MVSRSKGTNFPTLGIPDELSILEYITGKTMRNWHIYLDDKKSEKLNIEG